MTKNFFYLNFFLEKERREYKQEIVYHIYLFKTRRERKKLFMKGKECERGKGEKKK